MDKKDRQVIGQFANLTIAVLLLILEHLVRVNNDDRGALLYMIKEQSALMEIMADNANDVSRKA